MTKDEELKEAREWWIEYHKEIVGDFSEEELNELGFEAAEILLAYHHHRLETDVDGFNLSQITAKQSLDAARKSCQENKLPEPPKEMK